MPTATGNGIDVHYDVLGENRPGLPLVLTHGFASASAFWRPDVEPLAETRPLAYAFEQARPWNDRWPVQVPAFAS